MVPSGVLGSVWAMKSTLFPQSSTRALPLCFCLWLHFLKNHQDLPVLWLGSPLESLLIFPSHLAPVTTGIFSLYTALLASAAFLCPWLFRCPAAISLSFPISWDHGLSASLWLLSISPYSFYFFMYLLAFCMPPDSIERE